MELHPNHSTRRSPFTPRFHTTIHLQYTYKQPCIPLPIPHLLHRFLPIWDGWILSIGEDMEVLHTPITEEHTNKQRARIHNTNRFLVSSIQWQFIHSQVYIPYELQPRYKANAQICIQAPSPDSISAPIHMIFPTSTGEIQYFCRHIVSLAFLNTNRTINCILLQNCTTAAEKFQNLSHSK